MQDKVTNSVVEYVDRLRNYTTTNISSIQAGMIPEVLKIQWKVSPFYLDSGVKKYVFNKKNYVIKISGLRFKNNLPRKKNLIFKMNLQTAVEKELIHPTIIFVNKRFIKWSDITLVRDLKYTYLLIKNSFDFSIIDPTTIFKVDAINIPFNISYMENYKGGLRDIKDLFHFDSHSGKLIDFGDCIYYTTLENIEYKEFKNLVGATIRDIDLDFNKYYKLTPVNFICWENGFLSSSINLKVKNLNLITVNDGNPLHNDTIIKFFYRTVTNLNRSNITIPSNDSILKKAITDNDRPTIDIVALEKDFDFKYRDDMLYNENFKKGIRYIARYNDAFFDELYKNKSNVRTLRLDGERIKNIIKQNQKFIPAHDEKQTISEKIKKVLNIPADDDIRDVCAEFFNYYIKYNPNAFLIKSHKNNGLFYTELKKLEVYANGSNVFNINNYYGLDYRKFDKLNENKNYFEFDIICISRNNTDKIKRPIKKNIIDIHQKQYATKIKFSNEIREKIKSLLNNDSKFLSEIPDDERVISIFLKSETDPVITIKLSKNDMIRLLANDDTFIFVENNNLIDDVLEYPTNLEMLSESEIYTEDRFLAEFNFNELFYTIDFNSDITKSKEFLGPYKQKPVYELVNKEVVKHYDDSYTTPKLEMLAGLPNKLDGFVMIFKNGLLWEKYNRIRYENNHICIPLTQDEVDEINDFDDFEIVHFDNCNNNYLTVNVSENNCLIENTTIPYEDLIVLANFNKKHIYYDYLNFTKRSVYDVPFSINKKEKTILFKDHDYYGKTIYMASKRQFHYCFYNVTEPQVQFYLTKEFCCAKDKSKYIVFINGRMISKNMYHLLIQDPDNSVTEPVIHSRILCKKGDIIEIFYIPEQIKIPNIGNNNKASVVNVTATSDKQAVFEIPIPTRKYNISKENFFLLKGSVIVEQDRYNVIGTSIIFKEKEDYVEYGRELTFVFLFNELIEENPYGSIKEENMLTVSVATTYSESDIQTVFPIVKPTIDFDTSRASMFVTYRGLYINPRRYEINNINNTIVFKDRLIGLDTGTAVSFVWIYPTQKYSLNSYTVRTTATFNNQTTFNIPVPYSDYFNDQNKFLVTRNGIFLNSSDYAIDKNKNVLTLTSVDGLGIGQELVFTFFTGKNLSIKTEQIKITATKENQMVFQVPEVFHDVKNIYSKFFIVFGDTFIDPRRYEIRGTTIRFLNSDDALPIGKSLFFIFTYIEEKDSATSIIGDVHDASKYTNIVSYKVDATKDGQTTFTIPVENAAIYNKQFFVTVGSTFINETNYTVNRIKNTITFIDGVTDIKVGRHVYFTFIDSEYAVIEKDIRKVVAQANGQLEVDIPIPFENFFELKNNCLVYRNSVYFDPSRYIIKDNILYIKDEEDALRAGEDIVFMFLYTSNTLNINYKSDTVQIPKITEYGYIYLSSKEIRHTMNSDLFFLFINGKKINNKDILIVANNIIRIRTDTGSKFNPVIMDFTPTIPELEEYKQITSDFDLIMNKCTKDDINDMYNEYSTLSDIEKHIKPNTSQEAIINNIILNHYIANGISFGKPFIYTYDANTIERVNLAEMQNITHRFIESGWYDFKIPDGVNMININSISSSSSSDAICVKKSTPGKIFLGTGLFIPDANYIIKKSLRDKFKSIDKIEYALGKNYIWIEEKFFSNGHSPNFKIFDSGEYGISKSKNYDSGIKKIKTMNVLPGSTYRVTVPKGGFVIIGYSFEPGKDYDININSYNLNKLRYKLNGEEKRIYDSTQFTTQYRQEFITPGEYNFTVPDNINKILVSLCSGFEFIKNISGENIEIPSAAAVQLISYDGIDFAAPKVPISATDEFCDVNKFLLRVNGKNIYNITKLNNKIDGKEIYPFSNGEKFGNCFHEIDTVNERSKNVLQNHDNDYKLNEAFTTMVEYGIRISEVRPLAGIFKSTSIMVNPGDVYSLYIPDSYRDNINTSGAITITYKDSKEIKDDFYIMNTMDATKYSSPELDYSNDNNFEIKKDEIDHGASSDKPMDEDILEKDHPIFEGERPEPKIKKEDRDNLYIHTKKTE